MRNHIIKVTREHIQKALTDITYSDPIQVALEDAGFGKCIVVSDGFTIVGSPVKHVPFDVGDRLKAWQLTNKMEPFGFTVQLH